ncbi:MAG: hypothetical protein GY797_33485 [Deltaproteobacteria bacterium]|nr:hypothetical protein [Deltaproteobacteria bacterium]
MDKFETLYKHMLVAYDAFCCATVVAVKTYQATAYDNSLNIKDNDTAIAITAGELTIKDICIAFDAFKDMLHSMYVANKAYEVAYGATKQKKSKMKMEKFDKATSIKKIHDLQSQLDGERLYFAAHVIGCKNQKCTAYKNDGFVNCNELIDVEECDEYL